MHKRYVFCRIFILIALATTIFHFTFKGILMNYSASGQKNELMGKDKDGVDHDIVCYENWNNPYAEYFFNELTNRFHELKLVSDYPLETVNPVQCTARRTSFVYSREQIEGSLMFIGGSIPFGQGIPKGNSFPEIIHRMAVDGNGATVKVINYSGLQEDLSYNYEKFLSVVKLKPRSIVYVWTLAETPYNTLDPPKSFINNRLLDQTNYFMYNRQIPLVQLIRGIRLTRRDYLNAKQWYRRIHSPDNKDGMGNLITAIKNMKVESSTAGVDFKVVLFPLMAKNRDNYEFMDIHEKMSRFLKKESIDVFDLAPFLIKEPDKPWINRNNLRPNIEVHRRAAMALAPFLRLHTKKTYAETAFNGQRIRHLDIPADKYKSVRGDRFCFFIFVLLSVLLLICITTFFILLPSMLKIIAASGLKINLLLLLIVITGVCLRIFVSPHAHLVLGDEFDRLRVIEMWIARVFDADIYNDFPGTMMVYYPIYLLFGLNSQIGFQLSILMNVFSCVLLFVIMKMLLKRDSTALIATFLFATYPVCLRFSGTHAAEIPNLLFMLICVYALLLNKMRRDFVSSLLLFSSLSFFLFIRIHNVVFTVLVVYCFLHFTFQHYADKESNQGISRRLKKGMDLIIRSHNDIIPVIIFILCLICYFILLNISLTIGNEHRNVEAFTFSQNLYGNLHFFISNKYLPSAYTFLCCVAVFQFIRKRSGNRSDLMTMLFLLIWILIYFICHLQAQNGMYMRNTVEVRHTLDFTAPLLILSAIGISMIDSALITKTERLFFRVLVPLMIFLIPFSHINEIRDEGVIQNLLNKTISTASWYPHTTMFLTNTFLFHNALDIDLRANVRLLNKTNNVPRLCNGDQECVFVLFRMRETDNFESILNICPDSIHYYNLEVAVCPVAKEAEIPISFFAPPLFETGGGDYYKNLPYKIY